MLQIEFDVTIEQEGLYMKPLPIGVDNFKKLISNGYYYIDKTLFIKEILDKKGTALFFTRPRRFGKTLNLSMLQYFFENTGDEQINNDNRALFKGLKICDAGEKYAAEMTQYPVISLSLKSASQPTCEQSFRVLWDLISQEYVRHTYIFDSLYDFDKLRYQNIVQGSASMCDYINALEFLSRCLARYHQQPVILLIDEYDVPLKNAYLKEFYPQIKNFIITLFESVMKTNPYLHFAVVTGGMPFENDSDISGLNNIEMHTCLSESYGEYFGFTQDDVDKLLLDYGCSEKRSTIQKWYDGYFFRDKNIYNPWSILNYADALSCDIEAFPKLYWGQTSSNDVIWKLIEEADDSTRWEIENLISGETLEIPSRENVTCENCYKSRDNFWILLLFAGYLKICGRRMIDNQVYVTLAIPNTEVRQIFKNTITKWFMKQIAEKDLTIFYRDMLEGNTESFQNGMAELLLDTIGCYDRAEAFYFEFLRSILSKLETHIIKSNQKYIDNFHDTLIQSRSVKQPIVVIDFALADSYSELETKALNVLRQIEEKGYDREYKPKGYQKSIRYGIAFYKRNCLVRKEEIDL